MLRKSLFLGMLSVGYAYAQQDYTGRVGINTIQPDASLDIKERLKTNSANQKVPIDNRLQGVSLPNFTTVQRSELGKNINQDMKIGTLIYNTTENCIEMYKGYISGVHTWKCLALKDDNFSPVQQSYNIQPVDFEGNYIAGMVFSSDNKVKFKITNNGPSALNNVNLADIVQLQNGGNVSVVSNQNTSVSIGVGQDIMLSYTLQGTPVQGNLTATMIYGGAVATMVQTVSPAINPLSNVLVTFVSFSGTPYTEGNTLHHTGNSSSVNNTVTFKLKNNSNQTVNLPMMGNAVTITNGNANITAQAINNIAFLNPNQEANVIYQLYGTPEQGLLRATFNAPWGVIANGTTSVQVSSAMTSNFTNAPWMKLSEYAVNKYGNGFVTNHDYNNPDVGYFSFFQRNSTLQLIHHIPNYTVPTKNQWATIIPHNRNYIQYSSNISQLNVSETNSLGVFSNDYLNVSSRKTTYAIRFKNNSDYKSAWRYKYNENSKQVIIEIVPLTNGSADVNQISDDNWWLSNSNRIVKRIILPFYGYWFEGFSHYHYGKGEYATFWTDDMYSVFADNSEAYITGNTDEDDALPLYLLSQ